LHHNATGNRVVKVNALPGSYSHSDHLGFCNSLTKKIYKRYLEPLKRHEMFEIKFIRQMIYDEGFMMINL